MCVKANVHILLDLFTTEWFNPYQRGIFMISSAMIGVCVRCIVGGYFVSDSNAESSDNARNVTITRVVLTLATVSDGIFDVLQAITLIVGVEYNYETDLYVKIGTWLHVSNALMDFIKGVIEGLGDLLQDICLYLYWCLILILVMIAQSFNVVSMLFDTVDFDLMVVGIGSSCILLMISCCSIGWMFMFKCEWCEWD